MSLAPADPVVEAQGLFLEDTALGEPTADEAATLASIAADEITLTGSRLDSLMRRSRAAR